MPLSDTTRLSRLLAGTPDAITAAFFLLLWIAPQWLGPNALRTGLLMMLVELQAGGRAQLNRLSRPARWYRGSRPGG